MCSSALFQSWFSHTLSVYVCVCVCLPHPTTVYILGICLHENWNGKTNNGICFVKYVFHHKWCMKFNFLISHCGEINSDRLYIEIRQFELTRWIDFCLSITISYEYELGWLIINANFVRLTNWFSSLNPINIHNEFAYANTNHRIINFNKSTKCELKWHYSNYKLIFYHKFWNSIAVLFYTRVRWYILYCIWRFALNVSISNVSQGKKKQ